MGNAWHRALRGGRPDRGAMSGAPAGPARYPIRAVSRLTGIGIDTLRAWERRYGAVTPVRDDRGPDVHGS